MHGVLMRSSSDIQKDPDIDDCTLSRKSLEDYGVSSVLWRFSNCRSTDVTLLVVESNGLWRVLVLPQQYVYREICWRSPQSNVNSLQVGSLLPLTSFLFGRQKIQRVPYIDSSLKSISSRGTLHHEGTLNNLNKWDMLSIISSVQSPIVECEVQGTISGGTDANSVEDMCVNDFKGNGSTERYSRKKPRKKGKRNRNLKCSNNVNELQSGVTQNIQHGLIISSSANICNSLMNDPMTVSSISLGSSSGERYSQRELKSSDPIARTEVSSIGDILNSAGERKKCPKQHARNHYETEKRDKYFRRVPKDSTSVYASSTGHQNSHGRKENYQCIWKRVQKNDADGSNCNLEKLNQAFSQFDDRLKKNTLKKKLPSPVDSIVLSQAAHENKEKHKAPRSLRRNKSPGSLQENKSQCRKESPLNGACSSPSLKINMQSNDVVGSSREIPRGKGSINAANSPSGMSSFRAKYKKRNGQYVSSKPIPDPKACSRNLEATKNVPIVVPNLDDKIVEHQSDLFSRSEKFDDLTEQLGKPLVVDAEGNKMDKAISPSGKIKHEHDAVFQTKRETFRSLENDLRNISEAVSDAHRAQLASKAIETGKGYPAAEFEKLLHSASPVICPSNSIRTCPHCHSQATDAPLCRHEIPDIYLGNLWKWYEKHGSYGLEVKSEDHRNAGRYGMDNGRFRAYFVPYLSAIQLFKDRRIHPIYNDKTSESSPSIDLRSIFSVLVPQPLVKDSSSLRQKGVVNSSSEYSNGDSHHLPVEFKPSDDMELLFEYFESEQPQRRQPLFETIQELVSGNRPSDCKSYGDPSTLQSVSLHDLHPHSWFSVAWYPIYKIPDGNLRAAFLTYHSLGHFIHRDETLKACNMDAACVVSPIVGLQSYNAQGECWFQPVHFADEFLTMDLRAVVRERLRTLEQTASIMSRAVRKSARGAHMNRHPDYEFFISRQH